MPPRIPIALLLLALAPLAACHHRPAPADLAPITFDRVAGTITTSTAHSLADTTRAAKQAMHDMGYHSIDTTTSSSAATIETTEPDDSQVSIHLARRAQRRTDITISVDSFGNEAKARMLLDKLESHLHTEPPR